MAFLRKYFHGKKKKERKTKQYPLYEKKKQQKY